MANTLEAFLKTNRVPYRLGGTHQHVRHGWIGLHCPWCRSFKWHLGIRLADGYTSCWRCGRRDLGQSLLELSGLTWPDVRDIVSSLKKRTVEGPPKAKPGSKLILPKEIGPLQKPHCTYLKCRRFKPARLSEQWSVQGIGISGRLSWRLFIPVTLHGELVSWTTRSIGEKEPRYLSAKPNQELVPLKNVLYGADYADHAVAVVEGPTDAWRIGYGAVATLGTGYSETQMLEISSYPVRVICFDNSSTAQKRAEKLARQLEVFPGETYIVCFETGEDPAKADREEILEFRKKFLT